MGQVLHGSAKTTHAVGAELQRSEASVAALAERFGINPKTVLKWRKRASVEDSRMGPKDARSTVLTPLEEAAVVAAAFTDARPAPRPQHLPVQRCLQGPQP